MNVAALAVGAIVLLAMIAMSVWETVTLPPGAQVPVHHGIGGYGNWQPKVFALITYPVVGALILTIVIVASQSARSSGKTAPAVIAPVVLLVIAAGQYGAIRAAIRARA